jgi:hypothetical protein
LTGREARQQQFIDKVWERSLDAVELLDKALIIIIFYQ